MPPPPNDPDSFLGVLENVWWRLDRALDLDMIEWSAKLGALEALEAGTTAIIDHHESPNAIEGSLSVISDACEEVGVRINTCYGITDRHGADGAARGLAENERYLAECVTNGRRALVGVHAAFTCSDDSLAAAAEMAEKYAVGVHIHVAEGPDDAGVEDRIRDLTRDNWLIVHGVFLGDGHGLRGTIVHNPRSNMNNSVGYANPARFTNPIGLGTDGIGADMIAEFQLAFVANRAHDLGAVPDTAWSWLEHNRTLFPEVQNDSVRWSYDPIDPWHLAYTPTIRAVDVDIDGAPALRNGVATRVDADEVRAKAREQASRLHAVLRDVR